MDRHHSSAYVKVLHQLYMCIILTFILFWHIIIKHYEWLFVTIILWHKNYSLFAHQLFCLISCFEIWHLRIIFHDKCLSMIRQKKSLNFSIVYLLNVETKFSWVMSLFPMMKQHILFLRYSWIGDIPFDNIGHFFVKKLFRYRMVLRMKIIGFIEDICPEL